MKYKKTLIFTLIILVIATIFYVKEFKNQTVTYVCDYSDRFTEFQKATIEVKLEYKNEELIKENSIQEYYFNDFTSSYSKDYLSKGFSDYHASGYDIVVNTNQQLIKVSTSIVFEELDYSDGMLFKSDNGKVLLSDSITQLEADNCVKK